MWESLCRKPSCYGDAGRCVECQRYERLLEMTGNDRCRAEHENKSFRDAQ